jgi:hypothetical protein
VGAQSSNTRSTDNFILGIIIVTPSFFLDRYERTDAKGELSNKCAMIGTTERRRLSARLSDKRGIVKALVAKRIFPVQGKALAI